MRPGLRARRLDRTRRYGRRGTVALLAWSAVYLRVAAPINRILIAAARARTTPENTRSLQARWDSVITARALLMTTAVAALALTAILN